MTSAQQLIYNTVGRPPIEGAKGKLLKPQPGICSITGEPQEITADARHALGENFTDHSLWRAHTGRVGPAALWCCSGKGALSPRMWSWVCAPGVDLPDSVEKAPKTAQGFGVALIEGIDQLEAKRSYDEWTNHVAENASEIRQLVTDLAS